MLLGDGSGTEVMLILGVSGLESRPGWDLNLLQRSCVRAYTKEEVAHYYNEESQEHRRTKQLQEHSHNTHPHCLLASHWLG